MIKDMTNIYFTKLMEGLEFDYPKIDGSQTYTDSPSKFPWVYFRQLDAADTLPTLSGNAKGNNIAYEIQVYSKSNTESRKIANSVRKIMTEEQGFSCTLFRPVENIGTTSIHRFISRYEKLETTEI